MSTPWGYKDFVADALTRVPEVSCEELFQLANHRNICLLDVREADETATGVLSGAILLPRGLLEKHVAEHVPNRRTPVYIYCSTGNRSALAGDVLQRMGYEQVFNVSGGIERWRHMNLPISGGGAACKLPGTKLTWDDIRAEFAIVNRRVPVHGSGERTLVYLDHAASTHAPTSVLNAYVEFMEREYANIHRGTHLLSRKATERFEEAYYVVADYLGGELRRGAVCFTSNTTHAIDLCAHIMAERPGKVITTEMEHHSNELPHRRRGPILRARVDENGELDLDHMRDLLRRNEVKLVCVTAGSNVTGVMPPIHEVARLAHENGALILVDAAQALARMEIRVKDPDDPEHLDFVAGAGHKAYAPMGAGFLYGPRVLMTEAPPYIPGGGTAANVTPMTAEYMAAPDRHHAGTPNIAGVVAMSRALLFLQQIGLREIREHELLLTKRVLDGFARLGGITVYGPRQAERRLGVVSFNVDGQSDLLTAAVLSEEGAIAVRNGRFCSHIYIERLLTGHAKLLREQMVPMSADGGTAAPALPTGAVRASVGLYNDESDVDRLVEYVQRVRDRKWTGRYKVKGDAMTAEFAGRCADRWMERTQEADPVMVSPDLAMLGYEFEILQPEGACRSYLIADPETGEAAIVDPLRDQVDHYIDLLQQKRWRLRYTIETHSHADHLSGSVRLKELTGAEMVMSGSAQVVCVDHAVQDGDFIPLGSLRIEVVASPGHTQDSVCYLLPGRVLTGDTLLIGGCGRTDLPTGDSGEMYESLRRIFSLPDETLVLPAHDYDGRRASTIGQEKKHNPKYQIDTAEEFRSVMAKLDLPAPYRFREVLATNQQCQ